MRNNISTFWKIISFDRLILLQALTLVVMQVCAAIAEIFLVLLIAATFSSNHQSLINVAENELPFYLVFLITMMLVSKFFMIKLTGKISFGAVGLLSPYIFRKFLNIQTFNVEYSPEEKFTFLSNKIELVVHHLLLPMINIILAAILLIMFLGYIALKDPWLLIGVIFIVILGYVFPSLVLRKKIKLNARDINYGLSKNIALIRAGIFQVKEVTNWGLKDFFFNEQKNAVLKTYASKANSYEISMHPRTIIESVIYSVFVLAFILFLNTEKSAQIDITSLATSMFLILKTLPYMQQIYYAFVHIRTGAEIVNEFDAVLSAEFIPHKKTGIEKIKSVSIELCGVSKSVEDHYLFRNISFRIDDNAKVAILGPSGSGKSTLLEIIMGYVEPTDGYVLFNGCDILNNDFSEHIAYVPQAPFLFDDTVIENITFSKHRNEVIDYESLERAIDLAGLSTLTRVHDDFLMRRTGENGQNLSGGQAQRVALARALYSERKILILDEFTSALDTRTALEIVENLLKQNIVIIAVTHDIAIAKQFKERLDVTCWK